MSFGSEHKESLKVQSHVWSWGTSIAVLIGLITFAGWVAYPYFLKLERQALVNSNQYVEARKAAISSHHAQWIESDCGSKADNAICRSLVARIRAESLKIDQAMITPDIRNILTEVGAL